MREIRLPEVGENITSGTITKILVQKDEPVQEGQDLLEIETDKATIPVPSPAAGTIKEIHVKEGQEIPIGAVLFSLEESSSAAGEEKTPSTSTTASSDSPTPEASGRPETHPPEEKPASPSPETSTAVSSSLSLPPPKPATDTHAPLLIIGGGPGGYAAAFHAADTGWDVTLIDKEPNPGGVCLFRGCIPSKALLHAAKIVSEAHEARSMGIEFGSPKIDIPTLREWKEKVVQQLTGGLGQLSRQRKIRFIQGEAQLKDENTADVKLMDGSAKTLTFDRLILATGSRPVSLPFAPPSDRIWDSTAALALKDIPRRLLVVGGGYIGLELGTVYAELGSEVSVVEMLPDLLTGADRDLAAVLKKRLQGLFKNIWVNTRVAAMEESRKNITVSLTDAEGSTREETFDNVLVAIGRRPNTENIGLENTRIQLNDKQFIPVNLQRQTIVPHIFAIGDIAGDPMLAHKASHEGRVAVEAINGRKVAFEPRAIPAVVFTDPEIAWCGLTELEARQAGRKIKVVKFPWGASGRAVTLNRTDGLTKLIVDPDTDQILGVGIAGVGAGELIGEGVLAVEMGASAEDLKLSIHAHPTLSETLMETAEGVFGQSTHIYRPNPRR